MSFQLSFEFSDGMGDESIVTKDHGQSRFVPEFSVDLFVGVRVSDQS